MTKTIATLGFAIVVAMTVGVMVSQPQASTASIVQPNSTVVHKNMVFPLPGQITVESCKVSVCADV